MDFRGVPAGANGGEMTNPSHAGNKDRRTCQGDLLACGLYLGCPVCHPPSDADARPGPQPHNQVGTFRELLALAHTPRATPDQAAEACLAERVEKIVRRLLVDELPAAVEYIIAARRGE
jgi:hypothetical protein